MFSHNFGKKKREVKSGLQENPNKPIKKENERQLQDLIKNIYPGRKLYHRAKYIRDKERSFGEITVKSFEGQYIICDTGVGEKTFNISAIGKYLSLNQSDISDLVVLDGESDIREEELKNYKQYDKGDNTFNEEKAFFDVIKSKLRHRYETLSAHSDRQKYGLNDLSDSLKETFHSHRNYMTEAAATLEAINKPYFGRINLTKYNQKTIYIGDRNLPGISNTIYDWREPVCQIYYAKNSVLYDKYGLELIRKFDIYKGSFCGYYDSYIRNKSETNDNMLEVVDDFLLSVIIRQRENPKIHDIIQTIQNTQYKIISDELDKNLVIQGCAGSGKTMVLMHRLSYAVYNKKDLQRKNIKIITPNKNLNLELTDIAKKLQLADVDRYTLSEYYTQLIKKYCKKYKILTIPNLQSNQYKSTLISDDELTITQLNAIYGIDFGSDFAKFENKQEELPYLCNIVKEFCTEDKIIACNSRSSFLKDYDNHLKDLSNMLNEAKRVLNISEGFNFQRDFLERKSELETIRSELYNNINRAIQELEKYIEKNADKLNFKGDVKIAEGLHEKFKDIISVFDSEELYIRLEGLIISKEEKTYMEEKNYLEMKPVRKERIKDKKGYTIETVITPLDYYKQNIREKRNRFLQIHSFMSRIKLYIESLKRGSNYRIIEGRVISDFINRFNNLSTIIESLRNFQNKRDNSYLTFIWKVYIEQLKYRYNIPVNKKYQFEHYALLLYLYYKFGTVDNADKYLFIDEGQDFLESELSILTLINNNPTINIFGDHAQRTRNINKKYFFDTVQGKKFKRYELDVNYRNCKEITEHINKKCNKNMKPLGLNGSVDIVKFKNLNLAIFNDMKGREVLIIKDEEALKKLREKVKSLNASRINTIFDSEINFSENKLNVLNIKSSKGLEFKEVVVFDYKLTNNEFYIACSRALEKLTIIES